MLRAFLILLVVSLVETSAQATDSQSGSPVTHPWVYKDWVMVDRFDAAFWPKRHDMGYVYHQPSGRRSLARMLDWCTTYRKSVEWGWKGGIDDSDVYQLFYRNQATAAQRAYNPSVGNDVNAINASAGNVYSTVPYGDKRIGFVKKRVLYEHPAWANTSARFTVFGDSAWDPAWDPTANPTQDPSAKPTQYPTANSTQDPTANPPQGSSVESPQDSMVTVSTTVEFFQRRADESLVNGCHGILTPEQQTLLNAAYQRVLEAAMHGEWRVSGTCTHLGYVLDGSMLTTMDSEAFSLVVSKASSSIRSSLVTEASLVPGLPTFVVSANPTVSSFVIPTAKPTPAEIHRGHEDTIGEVMLTLPALISIIVVLVGVLLVCICYLKFRYKARADPVGTQPSAEVTALPRDCQKVSLDKAKTSGAEDEVVVFPGLGCADIPLKDDNEITEPEPALNKSLQCV